MNLEQAIDNLKKAAVAHRSAVRWLLDTIKFKAAYPHEEWKGENKIAEIANEDYKSAVRDVISTKEKWELAKKEYLELLNE